MLFFFLFSSMFCFFFSPIFSFLLFFPFFCIFFSFSSRPSRLQIPQPIVENFLLQKDDFLVKIWFLGLGGQGAGGGYLEWAHLRVTLLSCFFMFFFFFHVFFILFFFQKMFLLFLFSCVSFKKVSLLAFLSEFNCRCFFRSRCSMRMWCPDIGRIAGIGVEAPRLLKTEPPRLDYYCCCCCCCCGCGCWMVYCFRRIIVVRVADFSKKEKKRCFSSVKSVFCFTSNETCHFSLEKRWDPKMGCCLFILEKDTFQKKHGNRLWFHRKITTTTANPGNRRGSCVWSAWRTRPMFVVISHRMKRVDGWSWNARCARPWEGNTQWNWKHNLRHERNGHGRKRMSAHSLHVVTR